MKDIFREMIRLPWVRSIGFGILVASFLMGSLSSLNQAFAASGQDCDNNAVIYCGVSSVGDLQSKYSSGDGQSSGGNIQHIYNWFGISDSDMQSLGNNAKNGKVTDKGNVYVGDTMVATDAMTAGRQNMSGSTKQTSQDTTFYTRPPSVSFQSQSIDAYVVMKNGVFQFAVLKSCGNPVKATAKTQPAPTPTPQPAPAPAPAAAPQPSVCSGNTTNSNSGIASQGGNCSINTTTVVQQTPAPQQPTQEQTVTSPSPSGQCNNLSVTAAPGNSGGTPMTVQASVDFSAQNGAQLKSIVYDFGDGTVSAPTTQTSMTHTYAQPGTYTIKATLDFNGMSNASTANATTTSSGSTNINGGSSTASGSGSSVSLNSSTSVNASVTSATTTPQVCQASVTIAQNPTPPPSPTVTTTSTPQPVAKGPTQLVNTGSGSMAGVFGLTTVVSAFAYRLYLRHRLS
jgi:hypothetical protein